MPVQDLACRHHILTGLDKWEGDVVDPQLICTAQHQQANILCLQAVGHHITVP
jgi:hypothetical protein